MLAMEALDPLKPESLSEYVLRKRHERGLSQNDAAKRSGLSNAWFGRLETGTLQGAPRVDTLRKVAKGLGVDLRELLEVAGYADVIEGIPGTKVPNAPSESKSIETRKPWPLHDLGQSSAQKATKASEFKDDEELSNAAYGRHAEDILDTRTGEGHIIHFPADLGPVVRLPVFRVACGERVLVNEQPEEWQNWPVMIAGPDADGVMIVVGDSMLGAGINGGDLVFFQRINGHRPKPGNTVIAEVGGSAVCKIFERAADGTELLVSAPEDEDRRFFAVVDDSVRLVGIVKRHVRNI